MPFIKVHPEVREAQETGRAIVALESTILAHGLPRGENRRVADQIEDRVRAGGAVPATIAVLDGQIQVGLSAEQLDRLCEPDPAADILKLSVRDIGPALALGHNGATTVASTAMLAHRAEIEVFATGGLGGVHRGAGTSFDISADLQVLARTPMVVVCAGVKSILDVPATLEYLETMSVLVLGYRTDAFPGFYLSDSGYPVPWSVPSAREVAWIQRHRTSLQDQAAMVLANPLPAPRQLDPDLHDRILASGLRMLAEQGISGKAVTPALLAHFHEASNGASLRVNVDLVLANASLAGEVAVELCSIESVDPVSSLGRNADSRTASPHPQIDPT
jgi:pseudouridine-5'-phosphate glycosidase